MPLRKFKLDINKFNFVYTKIPFFEERISIGVQLDLKK